MNIGQIAEKAKLVLNNQVSYVILAVTAHCNARCAHCFYWDNIKNAVHRRPFELHEFEKISQNLGPLLLLNLCGGEPWLRKDLPDIARFFVKNNKVKYITIPSNGFLTELMTSNAERLLKENPDTFFRFGISIDAIGEAHDKIRDVKNLFKNLCNTAHSLAKLKLKYKNFFLVSSTVFSQDTENSIHETIDYIRKNLPFDQNSTTYIRGTPKEMRTKQVNLEKYKILSKELANRNKISRHPMSKVLNALQHLTAERVYEAENAEKVEDRPYDCYAGRKLLVINDIGDVSPCEILSEKFGNLRDYDFDIKKILSEAASKKLVKSIKDKKCNCTWECAIQSSMVFNPKEYPKIFSKVASSQRKRSEYQKKNFTHFQNS